MFKQFNNGGAKSRVLRTTILHKCLLTKPAVVHHILKLKLIKSSANILL